MRILHTDYEYYEYQIRDHFLPILFSNSYYFYNLILVVQLNVVLNVFLMQLMHAVGLVMHEAK